MVWLWYLWKYCYKIIILSRSSWPNCILCVANISTRRSTHLKWNYYSLLIIIVGIIKKKTSYFWLSEKKKKISVDDYMMKAWICCSESFELSRALVITERIQPTFTFTPRSLDISRPLTVGAVCRHGTLAYIPHRYPFIHLDGENQCRLNFLLKEISGLTEARTRGPSIP